MVAHGVDRARFNFQQLKLVPGDPTSYVVDGEPVKMERQRVTVKVNNLVGGFAEVSRDFWHTKYGPAVIFPKESSGSDYIDMQWTATDAWAFQDANADNLRLFDQWLAMNKAKSAQELVDSQKKIQGIPWVNTIGADSQGNAFYTDASVMPNLPLDKLSPGPEVPPALGGPGTGCLRGVAAAAGSQANLWILDGSRSDCGLRTDPDAVQPGIVGGNNLPVKVTTTWVQNANDSFWLTNPGHAWDRLPQQFTPILGPVGKEQGLRTRLGIDLISKRIAGADGLPGQKFSLETMKGMWLNHRSLAAELLLDDLVALCEAEDENTPEIAPACPVLAAYGKSGKADDKGGWLFARWYAMATANRNASNPTAGGVGNDIWAVGFDPANPETTPHTLNTAVSVGTPARPVRALVVNALARAVAELNARGVALNASHGDVQHTMRGNERISIPGCNTGCYPVTAARTGASDYGQVFTGSSFVMFAEMGPQGPRAQALLSYSQSEDPTSPYYADQTKRFSKLDFIDLPFTAQAIEAAKIDQITVPAKPAPQPQPQPQPQPGPQPAPEQPVTKPVGEPKLSLSSKKGLSLTLNDLGGRQLRSAKLTLPKGWSIDRKKAKKKSHLKVTSKGAKPKLKTTARTLTVTATGGTSLSIKSSKSLIKKKGKSKKSKTVTVKLALTFSDGSKQNLSVKVRAR